MRILKTLSRFLLIALVLALLFEGGMLFAYSIPNSYIYWSVTQGLTRLDYEGNYPQFFFENQAAIADGFSDSLMMKLTQANESDLLLVMAQIPTNARYWHGYMVILRPLLLFLKLTNIRQINMFFQFLLLFLVLMKVYQKTNIATALALMLSFSMACFFLAPMSLHFSGDFILMYLLSLLVVSFKGKPRFDRAMPYLFFIFGALDSYFTLLASPLIVLGVPALLALLVNLYTGETDIKTNWRMTLANCTSWAGGYGGLWATKWFIADAVLDINVLQQARGAFLNRTAGSNTEAGSLNYGIMFQKNLDTMFRPFGYVFLLIALIALLLLFVYKRPIKILWQTLPLAMVSLLPFAWYLMACNHSQVHNFFTYRNLIVFAFGTLSLVIYFYRATGVRLPIFKYKK